MKTYELNKIGILLTAVSDDLRIYMKSPEDFEVEYLQDLDEAVVEVLGMVEKEYRSELAKVL